MTPSDDLLNFVTSVSGDQFLKVEETFGDGFVRLKISEAERRQAKHDIRSVEDIVIELLRNSRDAHAARIFVASWREGEHRHITVLDDGTGIPEPMKDRVFEPRVTSKLESMVIDEWGVHGRGMALFSIRSNTQVARVAASDPRKGTAVEIVVDSTKLAEKTDQSTWPAVEINDEGALKVSRGPHNIVRRTAEFAIEHGGIDVFLGTPSEVLATMSMLARFELDSSELLFCDDARKFPVWQRPAAAADAAELAEIAAELAIPISERTAHRILGGELVPLRSVKALVLGVEKRAPESNGPDIYRDRRGLKIHGTDLTEFRRDLEAAFDSLAEKYYLHLRNEAKITVGRDDIRVRFEVEKDE
jgi:hypothetical protein